MGADCGAVDAIVAAVCHDLGQRNRDCFPDPSFAPPPESSIDRVPASIFRWHIAPRRTAAQPPEYAVDDSTVLLRSPTSTAIFRLDWQQALQNPPFRFGEIAPAQNCLQKAGLNQGLATASITFPNTIQKSVFFWSLRDRLRPMRKVTQRDWLALSAPAIASILVAYFHGQQKGWVAGIATGAIMFAFALWIWRRQIIKYPEDTWKARL